MAIIEVKQLQKSFKLPVRPEGGMARLRSLFRSQYQTHEAVKAISFAVQEGEALAFIGPNGAGKSTTIKMLTGILHPTAGEATVMGLTPWKQRQQLAFQIGSVFGQKSQLWLHLPPLDTFNLLARIYELDWSSYLQRRSELIELFELDSFLHTPARKLSLGQRMRCEIAASLLHKPRIIFLDEPTIGLDPVAKAAIRDLIRRANREDGVTVFLTSHDAGDIESLCKRVIIINEGQVVMDDSVNEMRRSFMQKREVSLKLGVAFDGAFTMTGVEVLKAKGYGLKLAVDTQQVGIDVVLSTLLQRYPVQDVTIEYEPLEDVIAAIYRGRGEGRWAVGK
ncbi:MAG TPA: ATP-binding cassette domain-containing protein [Symbiobacteriaceae bacterium]|nr:ATP-binding cassette domain-containing protein [Symbiobacteriaceae bacterium]